MINPVAVVVAMENKELNYLKTKIENKKEIEYKSFKFIEGTIFGKNIVLCVSNIGLINAGIATTILIEKYNPMVIINEGLAGGYTEDIKTKEIVIGVDAINITSVEYKGTGTKVEDYEITNFSEGEENRLIRKIADKKIIEKIKRNISGYKFHFRNNWKWRCME